MLLCDEIVYGSLCDIMEKLRGIQQLGMDIFLSTMISYRLPIIYVEHNIYEHVSNKYVY